MATDVTLENLSVVVRDMRQRVVELQVCVDALNSGRYMADALERMANPLRILKEERDGVAEFLGRG